MNRSPASFRLPVLTGGDLRQQGDELLITVPPGQEASLTERYDGQASESKAKIRLSLGENARLIHYKVVREGPDVRHESFLEVEIERAASFRSHVFLLSGARVTNTIRVKLSGEGAECELNGLYLASGEELMETHTLIEHLKPHGTSREFYKGILDQKAQGLFDGLIVVGKDAQQTDSAQTNKNLLLSPTAKAKSNPELKILVNDVKCKHGSTIGQIDPNQLFYMRSRGVPLAEARRLLVLAFASEMISLVAVEPLRQNLEQWLLAKFKGA